MMIGKLYKYTSPIDGEIHYEYVFFKTKRYFYYIINGRTIYNISISHAKLLKNCYTEMG